MMSTNQNIKALSNRILHPLFGDGLRAKALRGSGWAIAGHGAQQVLRLGSNLILTRLLFPEAFGLMALANTFLMGLHLLSDIGVGPSIIQNKHGDTPEFLATAWTLQVIRGLIIFVIACLIAYPVSIIYDEPLLFPILIFLGSTSIIAGFQSIGIATANRNLALGRLTLIEFVSQGAGIAAMIAWAWVSPSVWSLVGGGIISSLVSVLLGYKFLRSDANRFHLDKPVAKEIFHFGKWIFLATALTFLGGQGLRLLEGYLVPIDALGLLNIAGSLGWMAGVLIEKVSGLALLPAFAALQRDRPEHLPARLRESRSKLFWTTLPIFAVLILFGRELIDLMYDDRYLMAGTYLVIGATRAGITAQRTPFGMVLISVGDSFGHSIIMGVTFIARVAAEVIGFHFGGIIGMLAADSISVLFIYPFEAWRLKRLNLWFPGFDFITFSIYPVLGIFSYFYGPFLW